MIFPNIEALDDELTRPSEALIEDLRRLDGDFVVLGAGGKLGPSLVRLATRAIAAAGTGARVHAVSRFSADGSADVMSAAGAEIVRADIGDDDELAALPDAANVVYLVGAKFGSATDTARTWETNAYLPGRIARRYPRARIVALSTGNVYPPLPASSGGASEHTAPAPVGEYAMSSLGRERVLQAAAAANATPLALIRLNYAVEMRYGVLVDLARSILDGAPISLAVPNVNVVWQGYANEVILRSLLHARPESFLLNLTGPETLSVRSIAERLAAAMDRTAIFEDDEDITSLLSDAALCFHLFGYPSVTAGELVEATADWILAERPTHAKPTKFQRRDGRF